MIHNVLGHWVQAIAAHVKTEAMTYGIVSATVAGIGLLANEVTSPKVLSVMVFLADWNMLWTWEWWVRTIFVGAISAIFLWWQRRYFNKQIVAQKLLVTALQTELRHADLMIVGLKSRINILERK